MALQRLRDFRAPPARPESESAGCLMLVGTPIGNLGDITLRAIEALRTADAIAAEDTRRTRVLLSHLGIEGKPLCSLDAHASPKRRALVIGRAMAGERVVVVSDAGMPGISDPGARLVSEAAAQGVPIQVIPGPSSVTAAATLSGLVDGPFFFQGFLPRKGTKRGEALRRVTRSPEPVVLFEAPSRVADTLKDLAELAPDRQAVVCRELTKAFEQTVRGTLRELSEHEPFRGELVIVIAPAETEATSVQEDALDEEIRRRLAEGDSVREIARALALEHGLARRQVYSRVLSLSGTAAD